MNRTSILDTAAKLITGDRQDAYGDVREAYSRLAQMWSGLLGHEVTPVQVCLCLAAMKLMRAEHRGGEDDFVDLCGYAALAGEIA